MEEARGVGWALLDTLDYMEVIIRKIFALDYFPFQTAELTNLLKFRKTEAF